MGRAEIRDGAGAPVTGARKAPTIYDVAELAGVSHQTVSRLLKGDTRLKPKTREKVEAALKSLDYRPNQTARLLARNRPHRIAAFTHETAQVGPSRIAQGASWGAREAGYLLDLVSLDTADRASIMEAIALFDRPDVAGILALVSTDEVLGAFAEASFGPVAFVSTEPDDPQDRAPSSLSARAMTMLVEHAVGLGHRRFVHLAGPPNWAVSRNRVAACRRALLQHGLELEGVTYGDWSAQSGYDAVDGYRPSLAGAALLCANDQVALGAIAALDDQGLSVPGDVSVAGIDDVAEARFYRPALTTVRLDFEDQGRQLVEILIAQIEGREAPVGAPSSAELIVRASTTAPLRLG